MIISTGMRTDIPAFYAEWLVNRIKEGYVCTDLITFCTKNPAPMLPYMDVLKLFGQYWFVTITPYGRELEPHVPPWDKVIEDFIVLSKRLGADCMGWRYDPILINTQYTLERHIADFAMIAEHLAGYTHTCVISFLDLYEKVKRNFPEAREISHADKVTLVKEMVRITSAYDMVLRPCAEGREWEVYGADCSGCMTKNTYETALKCRLNIPKTKSQRNECGCILGRDIGQYGTCGHLCRYCYANASPELVMRNRKKHDSTSPFLIGHAHENDIIHDAVQESWIDRQMTVFDLI